MPPRGNKEGAAISAEGKIFSRPARKTPLTLLTLPSQIREKRSPGNLNLLFYIFS
jgi:hypothetical protein